MKYSADLRPFVSDFMDLPIGEFLTSSTFERNVIKWGFGDIWQVALEKVENSGILVLGFDMSSSNSKKAFLKIVDTLYSTSREDVLHKFVYNTLITFIEWNQNPFELREVIEDLKLLSFPNEMVDELDRSFQQHIKITESRKEKSIQRVDSKQFKISDSEILSIKKNEWINLLSKAKIEQVIEAIISYLKETNTDQSDIINLSSRYYRLQKKVNDRIINSDEEDVEMNRINKSIVTLINNI